MANAEEWRKRIQWSASIDCWKVQIDVFASLWVEGYLTCKETLEELAALRHEVTSMAIDMAPVRPNDQQLRKDVATALSEINSLENACRDKQSAAGVWERWEVLRKQVVIHGRELPPLR